MKKFRIYAPRLINSSEQTIEQAIPIYGGDPNNPYIRYIEIEAEDIGDENRRFNETFIMTNDEVKALYDYFTKRAGYISYEFDMPIIKLIKKLDAYLTILREL